MYLMNHGGLNSYKEEKKKKKKREKKIGRRWFDQMALAALTLFLPFGLLGAPAAFDGHFFHTSLIVPSESDKLNTNIIPPPTRPLPLLYTVTNYPSCPIYPEIPNPSHTTSQHNPLPTNKSTSRYITSQRPHTTNTSQASSLSTIPTQLRAAPVLQSPDTLSLAT